MFPMDKVMVEVLGLMNRQNVILLEIATNKKVVKEVEIAVEMAGEYLARIRKEFSVNHYRIEEILSRFMS